MILVCSLCLIKNLFLALINVKKVTEGGFEPTPICLPDNESPSLGDTCYVAGWGLLSDMGPLTNQLNEVDLKIADTNDCRSWYRTYYSTREIFTDGRNLCAGNRLGGKDICLGDSGGPLMCQRKDSCDWYAAGLVSWSHKCGKTFGVYSVPKFYQSWIESAMKVELVEDCKTCETIRVSFDGDDHVFYRKSGKFNFKPIWQSSKYILYWFIYNGDYTSWLIIKNTGEVSNSIEDVDLVLIGHNTQGDYFCPQEGFDNSFDSIFTFYI